MSPTCPGGSRASRQVLAPLVAARMGSIACGFNLPMLVDLSTYCLYIIYMQLYAYKYIYMYIHTVQAYLSIYIYPVYIYTCLYSICIHYVQYIFQ